MANKLRLGLACALVHLCVACTGDYGDDVFDKELISGADGSDPVRLLNGGYWWSYKDNCGSTVEPSSDARHPFRFERGGHHKRAAKIAYEILAEPPDSDVGTKWRFRDSSGSYAYPTGGIGFSLQNQNAVYAIPKSKLGLRFWAKGTGSSVRPGITVEFPTADTDVALPGDRFTTTCTCGMRPEKLCLPQNGVTETNTKDAALHTCFANFYYRVELSEEWRQYAVLFKDLQWADEGKSEWVDRGKLTAKAEDTDDPVGWDRNKALKVQFAAYRPGSGEESSRGELWIDQVAWLVAGDGVTESGPIPE